MSALKPCPHIPVLVRCEFCADYEEQALEGDYPGYCKRSEDYRFTYETCIFWSRRAKDDE
jgi:hypothetical protein